MNLYIQCPTCGERYSDLLHKCRLSTATSVSTTGWVQVAPVEQYGWECPKCGGVNAPWMPTCANCKPKDGK